MKKILEIFISLYSTEILAMVAARCYFVRHINPPTTQVPILIQEHINISDTVVQSSFSNSKFMYISVMQEQGKLPYVRTK